MTDEVVTTILTQYHASKGLKVFKEIGVEAVLTKLQQLHERMVMEPQDANKMSSAEKQGSL